MLSAVILLLFILAYYIKDKLGINLLPHRHLPYIPRKESSGQYSFYREFGGR